MKYIETFSEKRVFDFSFVVQLTKSKNLARETLRNYIKKGYIKRVKKNLYVTMSFETSGVIPSKYEIASKITRSSYVSHHSAFEYYGYNNQVYHDVITASMERFRDFTFEYTEYKYKNVSNDKYVDENLGVRVSTLPKTIVDCIDDVKSYDDMEELIYNLSALPIINGAEIMDYLLFVDKKILFNKVGLILSHFNDGYLVDDSILNRMKALGIKGVKYFTNEKHRLNKYYKEWNLYCYNLDKLIVEDGDEKL
jgi:predicted transcriptional regulator of viral defense system